MVVPILSTSLNKGDLIRQTFLVPMRETPENRAPTVTDKNRLTFFILSLKSKGRLLILYVMFSSDGLFLSKHFNVLWVSVFPFAASLFTREMNAAAAISSGMLTHTVIPLTSELRDEVAIGFSWRFGIALYH